MKIRLALLLSLGLAVPASAGITERVQDLGWLAGTWSETKAGVTTREAWLAPMGGVMGGASQTNMPGKAPDAEFMRITTEKAGPTFTAIIDGQAPTPFVLKPGKPREAVFENLGHDFPQRVIYRRCGPKGEDLCARVEGLVNGKREGQDWHYTRVRG